MPDSAFTSVLGQAANIIMGSIKNSMPDIPGQKPVFNNIAASPLPRRSPESQGISSKYISDFFEEISGYKDANLHSVIIMRGGNVVAESYFKPYRKEVWQVSHSICKTFVGTAIGMAIDEGLISPQDLLIKFFKDEVNLVGQQLHKDLTIKQVLRMSSGIGLNESKVMFKSKWIDACFSSLPAFKPGIQFNYNSLNSYLLAAVIYKAAGCSVMDYLKPRLFQPLGFGSIGWEKSPEGIEKGGWGMYVLPEDLAKLGLIYLQGGVANVNGRSRRFLSQKWVKEATNTRIKENDSEYGYQMWTDSVNGTFTMNGLFGQYILGIPKQNMLIVSTAGAPHFFCSSDIYAAMYKYFVTPKLSSKRHMISPIKNYKMKSMLAETRFKEHAVLNMKPIVTSIAPEAIAPYLGKRWKFAQNMAGMLPIIFQGMNNNFSEGTNSVRLEADGGRIKMYWEEGEHRQIVPVGINDYCETTMDLHKEKYLVASKAKIEKPAGEGAPYLKIEVCFLECTSVRQLHFKLENDDLCLHFTEEPELFRSMRFSGSSSVIHRLLDFGKVAMPMVEMFDKNGETQAQVKSLFEPTITGTTT